MSKATRTKAERTYQTFTKILFDPLPHVIGFALAIHIDRPITFILLHGVPQIVLTGEDNVLAILADVIAIAILFVSKVSIWLKVTAVIIAPCFRTCLYTLLSLLCRYRIHCYLHLRVKYFHLCISTIRANRTLLVFR